MVEVYDTFPQLETQQVMLSGSLMRHGFLWQNQDLGKNDLLENEMTDL